MRYETIEKDGKHFVMLPMYEFNKLMEDAEMVDDIKAYDAAIIEGGEPFPAEVVYAIIEGENPIKVFRQYRGMKQDDIATQSGLSRAYICEIESGKKNGSIASLKAIAEVLEVDVDDLI